MHFPHHRDHGASFDSNTHQNAHVAAVLSKITSETGNLGWVLRRMSYTNLCLMNTLIDGYDPASRRMVLLALKNELRGATFRSVEMIFARTVVAPVTASLLQQRWITEEQVTEHVQRCLPNPTMVSPVPARCDDRLAFLQHVTSQRGALIHHMVCGESTRSLDHLIWLGERHEAILPVMGKLKERNSTHVDLINGITHSGTILAEGVL